MYVLLLLMMQMCGAGRGAAGTFRETAGLEVFLVKGKGIAEMGASSYSHFHREHHTTGHLYFTQMLHSNTSWL